MNYDVAIIGGGIIGCALAYELSKYDLKVILIEKENDISCVTTKANSGIIHGGYDPKPNTLLAKLNVEGNKLTREYVKKYNVNFKQIGSLVVSNNENKKVIDKLYKQGIKNKVVGLEIINSHDLIKKLEPNISDDISYALNCSSAGIISPWEFALSLAYNAINNGVDYINNSKVTSIIKNSYGFKIHAGKRNINAKYVLNAAGLYADEIYSLVCNNVEDLFKIIPCKGEYYLLDKECKDLVNHVIFQIPSNLGKGVLISQSVHGNIIVGPNASYQTSKEDFSTSKKGLDYIKNSSLQVIKNIDFYTSNIRNFSGLRAIINNREDFLIEESKYVPHFINVAGIKSPGLSSALAISKYVLNILSKCNCLLKEKKIYEDYVLPTFFNNLSMEDKNKLIASDPRYGKIICRCECVTEKEIINSLHAPISVPSIDGIKRRTNAGMGRCQGGFCMPKIFEIIKKELNIPYNKIYQDKEGSYICTSKAKIGDLDD